MLSQRHCTVFCNEPLEHRDLSVPPRVTKHKTGRSTSSGKSCRSIDAMFGRVSPCFRELPILGERKKQDYQRYHVAEGIR
ncbi:MAG TPA: hypothetical protein PK992_15035, partial [Planctomycetaceae bacterium]|nr:hypothetical protein [Planctomycetaceae bacterium]